MIVALAAAVAASAPVRALVRPSPDTALAQASAAAVRGTVTAMRSTVDDTGTIYTVVTIEVARAWGFPDAPARVDVRLLGGVHDSTALVVGGQARFTPGEDVLVLLEVRPRDGSLAVTGLERGKWTVQPALTADAPAIRALHLRAPGETTRTTVADVEALASLAGTRVRLPAHWSATRGLGDGAGRTATVVTGADLNPTSLGRWHEADWGAPVLVDSAPNGHALFPGGGFAQALRALGAWSAAGALHLAPGTLRTPRCFGNNEPADGRISIAYDDPCDEIPDTSPTLAIGGAYFDLQDQRAVQGITYGRITKGMVVLDNAASKFAGLSTGCYEEILTHELGHAIGLAHTSVEPSVMAPWLSPACIDHTESQPLQVADRTALWARYPTAPLDGPPGVPGGLTASALGDTVSLSWSPATGAPATAYQIIAGSMPGAADRGVTIVAQPSLVASGVPRGVYYVRVAAINALGISAPGADVMVTVGTGLPGTPVGLMAAAGPAGSVRVMWQRPISGPLPDAYRATGGHGAGASRVAHPRHRHHAVGDRRRRGHVTTCGRLA
ncbi:MAG: matrixin family metalloprotease [Vicinamibacterales bacterium]